MEDRVVSPSPPRCRGEGKIDAYSPLIRVGVVRSLSEDTQPGGLPGGGGTADQGTQMGDLEVVSAI